MKRIFQSFYICAPLLLAAFLTSAAGDAAALVLKGKVANGTTGETNIDIDVDILEPSGGMKTERSARATGGFFFVANLDDSASVYIVRVHYKGIHYDYPVRTGGADTVETTAYVYEQTSSWKGVRLAIPRLSAGPHGDHLLIERVYEISNNSEPPRTIYGEDGYFRVTLPEEMISFNGLYVTTLGVPVERELTATGQPGEYFVDYPLRPGVTHVGMSYTVPYAVDAFVSSERVLYDIEKVVVFSKDPGMKITSDTNVLVDFKKPQAAVAYTIEGLERNSELRLRFAGRSENSAEESHRTAVFVRPNWTERFSFTLMIILLAVLLAFLAMAKKDTAGPADKKSFMERRKNTLLARLAKLDDLYETQTVPAAVYYAKRAELKDELGILIHRLGRGTSDGRKDKKRPTSQ